MSTLRNAASVLRLLSPERPELSVTEVGRLLGIPKSSTSRLLKAMMEEGFLTSIGKIPRYRAGHLLMEVASLYANSSTLMEAASAALTDICKATGHSGYISILDKSDILVLRVFRGTQPLRVVTPLGSRAPAYATSTGRALLARLTDEQVRKIYPSAAALTVRAENAPRSIDDLLGRLAQTRRLGWSEAIDEAVADVGSVSVAVGDPAGELITLCVSFAAHLVPKAERLKLAETLVAAAMTIEGKEPHQAPPLRKRRAMTR